MKSIHYNLAAESIRTDDDNDDDDDDDGGLGFRDSVKWLRLKSELIDTPNSKLLIRLSAICGSIESDKNCLVQSHWFGMLLVLPSFVACFVCA